ncbi:MAG TPA: heme o synthase [Gemmatimonadales bacterium]|nr:heme o synthase [Gemmatimonadales bacterium]
MTAVGKARAAAFLELTKPGITRMVVLTAAAGFYLGSRGRFDLTQFLETLAGTALVAAGSSALNQLREREIDARMDRTRGRPLPSGRVTPAAAALFSWTVAVLGVGYLAWQVNLITALLALATLISYVFLYTPLKQRTSLNTLVGAVPGALPVVGGWTAAGGHIDGVVLSLFWILFLWQLPHFLALAWLYREDYRRGGFEMLSLDDVSGRSTGRMALLYAITLLPVSLLPTLLRLTGTVYFFGALVLGVCYAGMSLLLMRQPSERPARRLFFTSITYLPLLLALMVIDKG